jgi:thiamine-phosphate pyrophosphorylase
VTRDLPVVSAVGARRQARLVDARLAVVVGTRRTEGDLAELLTTCCGASADLLLLRDTTADETALRAAAAVFRRVADDHGVLFVLADLPGLAADVGADGVQVGQTEVHPDHARRIGGPDLLVGRVVRSRDEVDRAADEDVDYLVVGPVHSAAAGVGGRPDVVLADRRTPGIGLAPVTYAARHAPTPWFVGGGLDLDGAAEVLAAGARRLSVGACVTGASDPAEVVWRLRRLLGRTHT